MPSIVKAAHRAVVALALAAPLAFTFPSLAHAQVGIASVYSTHEQGNRTASGIPLRNDALTAAHRTLPFGTRVRVTNLRNHRSVVVKITDRGPYVRGRIIDLTPAGAQALAMDGLAPVNVEVV
jgi:rare lipoprotein A